MIKKQKALCKKLVIAQIDEILSRYARTEQGKCYLVKLDTSHNDSIVLSPTYDTAFFFLEDFLEIAKVCGMRHYVEVGETIDHRPTPQLIIF